MTNIDTKKELSEEFSGIKYILTSGMRSKLLLAMYDKSKNLDELRNDLKKPSATILHGLKELENINLIRKVQKSYELTSNGFLLTANMIKLIENWFAINKNKIFWNSHDLDGIPDDMLKEIHLLKGARYITSTTSDLSNAFNSYIKLISKSKKLNIILPIYSENHFKHLIKLLKDDKLKKLELIISKEVFKTIEENELFKKELLDNEKVKIRCIERKVKVFLTYGPDFMSLTLFFKDGHYDDSQILIGKDKNAIRWAECLEREYKKR
ncbi:helix-turn-helix transcriptional regulator [Methanobrevibacter sp.]|uniref:helix-turn-helix transcriptional regulator n=1 Tax=Methanobrevibacter sp. TaxID=66852 RepID=UPI00386EA72A